jgi:hypothetical protein
VERLAVKFLRVLFVDVEQSVFTCTDRRLHDVMEEQGKGFLQLAVRRLSDSD